MVAMGRVTFFLWSRLHKNMKVTVMRTLPSRPLIGRRFLIRHNMNLQFGSGLGSYSADTPTSAVLFSGRIFDDQTQASDEQVEEVQEAD